MSTIGTKIKNRRKQLGWTQEELAIKMGYKSKSTINKIEQGINDIPQSKITLFAEALNTTPAFLMGWENPNQPEERDLPNNIHAVKTKRFPMLGEIACGEPIFTNENHESYIDASEDIKADFCLIAKGDSMIGARIHNGDVVFIRKQPIVENGEIAAVIIDNEATLKRWYYYPENQKLILNPENSSFAPLVYVGPELDTILCLGKAVCFMSNL